MAFSLSLDKQLSKQEIEYLEKLSSSDGNSYIQTFPPTTPRIQSTDPLKVVTALFLAIMSPFVHRYRKTPAITIVVVSSAVGIAIWGLFLSTKENREYRRLKNEIKIMECLTNKLNFISESLVVHIQNKTLNKIYNSLEDAKKACQQKVAAAFDQIIGADDINLDELKVKLKGLINGSTQRFSELRSNLNLPVDQDLFNAFQELVAASQRVTHGYLFKNISLISGT